LGVKLSPLIKSTTHDLAKLTHHRLVIDGTNVIIAALQKIRPKGQPLTNRWGEPLAQVHGIFFKTLRLLESGIRPIYVFDGIPPSEKRVRNEQLLTHLQQLWQAYECARQKGDVNQVRNLFRSVTLTYKKALTDAIELLKAMGVPALIAPSEGEAQGTQLVQVGLADALYTPDYDALLFGCPVIMRRLDLSQRQMDLVHFNDVLQTLGLIHAQLVDLGIMVGTDFNSGIPRIGPKRALTLLHKYGQIENIPNIDFPPNLVELRALFLEPVVTHFEPYPLPPNVDMCRSLLIKKGFSERRADRARIRLLAAHRAHRTTQQKLPTDLKHDEK
jgi:flap endonuclease-1